MICRAKNSDEIYKSGRNQANTLNFSNISPTRSFSRGVLLRNLKNISQLLSGLWKLTDIDGLEDSRKAIQFIYKEFRIRMKELLGKH